MWRRFGKWLLVISVVLIFCLIFEQSQKVAWVGKVDLEVEFFVTDSESNSPVPNSMIELRHSEPSTHMDDADAIRIATDQSGMAVHKFQDIQNHGTYSRLKFTNTYGFSVPMGRFRATAQDHEPSAWRILNERNFLAQVQKSGVGLIRLTVRVPLHRKRQSGHRI